MRIGAYQFKITGDINGNLEKIVIYGRPRLFGILGREEDIIIPWADIDVIGQETILINSDPAPFIKISKTNKYSL